MIQDEEDDSTSTDSGNDSGNYQIPERDTSTNIDKEEK